MFSIPEELKLRIISGTVLFSFAVFIITLGGFFYVGALILLAIFCAAEFFSIVGNADMTEEEHRKWTYYGVIFIGIPAISFYVIRDTFDKGLLTTFWFFILISMVDTFAYFTGKLLGKHKLAPKISPSKTIEGLLGGVLIATLISLAFFYFFNSKLNIIFFTLLSMLLGVISQISDITESYFKRKFGVKDSSNLIPGHGGFLDRLDGYFLSAPALLIFYFLSKMLFGLPIF
jgi:phosphatidate cytidylyltransferase